MNQSRSYREFTYREAVFRICCDRFDWVTRNIVEQRHALEAYIQLHPEFGTSFGPIPPHNSAPATAKQMARAAELVGVGPMAAVAGMMAESAGRAGMEAGATEVIIDNGGDLYIHAATPVVVGLFPGAGPLMNKLAFSLQPEDTPIAICSSSGKMGHSQSLGQCDLATVVARDTALADAAATHAANQVSSVDDVDVTLEKMMKIPGVEGVLIIQGEKIGLAGELPPLVKQG